MLEMGQWPNRAFSPRPGVLVFQGPSSPHELVVLRQTFRSAWGTGLDLKHPGDIQLKDFLPLVG